MQAVFYSLGWFSAVLLAGSGYPLLAAFAIVICFELILMIEYRKDKHFWIDLFLASYALMIGIVLEVIFIRLGVVIYEHEPAALLPPLWILGLYPLFSTTFNHSLSFINRSPLYPIIIGLMAPLSYFAGERFNACELPKSPLITYVILSAGWILCLLILTYLNKRLLQIDNEIDKESVNKETLLMLYDGKCPHCSREVCLLRESPGKEKILFEDISDPAYKTNPKNGLDFDTTMKELYIVVGGEKILKGTPAFYRIWSRANWKGLAMMTEAPLYKNITKGVYKLFARYRQQIPAFLAPRP